MVTRTIDGKTRVERALDRLGPPSEVLRRHDLACVRRMARCPFHEDREPSLSLYRSRRDGRERWRCHGCDIGGDAIDLEARLTHQTVREVIAEWSR